MGDENIAESTDNLNDDTTDKDIINPDDVVSDDNKSGEEDTPSEKKLDQEEVNAIVSNAKAKLNKKHAEADAAAAANSTELELANQKNKILEVALAQERDRKTKPTKPNAPNVDDFDGGVFDLEFIKQQNTFDTEMEVFNKSVIADEVTRQVSKATKNADENARINASEISLQQKQTGHYDRVKELDDIPNYVKHENAALEIFGQEHINTIINTFDDSQNIIFYLGTEINQAEANRIKGLFKTNPLLGVSEIGGIRQKIKVNPKNKLAPEPDTEVVGDNTNDSNNRLLKQLDKLREEARGGDMTKLMEFKRKHPELV